MGAPWRRSWRRLASGPRTVALVPRLEPQNQLGHVALVALLADDGLDVGGFVLVHPQLTLATLHLEVNHPGRWVSRFDGAGFDGTWSRFGRSGRTASGNVFFALFSSDAFFWA